MRSKMGRKEENIDIDLDELNDDSPRIAVEKTEKVEQSNSNNFRTNEDNLINCLRNEKVIVRFVPKQNDFIQDKKHIAYGGMIDSAKRTLVTPILSTGSYKNVLTNSEKDYLEYILGLEKNALSIYRRNDNFWDTFKVTLYKQDTILDLSDPTDYIRYKVLLANSTLVAPNVNTLKDNFKASYMYVLMEERDENFNLKDSVNTTMKCFEELGKVRDNYDILKTILETIDGRTISENTKIEFLQSKCHELINNDAKYFYKTITDEQLHTKVLINKAVSKGVISKRGDYYYYSNEPLCNNNENPTITIACKFLDSPKNQELKFAIEAKLK